ncbi:MarR family winged helix-turn-helix transcriptional regulator [Lacrimispora sp.]|uniref:MarR family winged helix-turn-helix transcriptional regulator n=1 Tax=Lacrimispora sp. TaxID=2719234 RepID=UPI003993F721
MKSFHYLLMAGQSIYQRRVMDRLRDTDLTSGQPKVLDYLRNFDGATQKEIADACFLEAATITSVLNGMEAKGLIVRKRLNGNRRSYHVFMTEKGKVLQKKVEEIFLQLEEETFRDIPEEKRAEFLQIFSKIHKNMLTSR